VATVWNLGDRPGSRRRAPETSASSGGSGVGRIDAAVEELRHAAYGMFGPALRARFLDTLGWEWSLIHYRALRIVEGTDPLRPTVGDLAAALLVQGPGQQAGRPAERRRAGHR
jgi:hypothetical protein